MVSKLKLILFVIVVLIITVLFHYQYRKTSDEKRIDLPIEQFTFLSPTIRTNKLFDLDFFYNINSNICQSNRDIFAIFIVTSYFGNVETRSSMRRAYSQDKLLNDFKVLRVFLLGLSPDDKYTTQKAVENESNRFNDIIQGNFHEAYRNLTYKHVMGLKWVSENCPKAKYIIKMDDDIVVDVRGFLKLLQTLILPQRNLLAGYQLKNLIAKREPANKWYVTKEEFTDKIYPTFLSGWLYVTNIETVKKLLTLSYYEQYFWIDDVFVTGILANKLKISHFDLSKYYAVHTELLQCCINDIKKYIKCDFLIGPNGGDNNLFYEFNKIVLNCKKVTCKQRHIPLNETCVAEKKTNLGRGDAVVNTYQLL